MVGQQDRNPILRIIFNQCIYKVIAVLRDDITQKLRLLKRLSGGQGSRSILEEIGRIE